MSTITIWTEQSAESLNIYSDIDFSIATEKCRNCELGFETGSFIKDTNLDVVKIIVDPDKFKAAALDVLGKYLDVTVALYMR